MSDGTGFRPSDGGGGSAPTWEWLAGSPIALGAGSVKLTWDTKLGGDSLLDLTVPDLPTLVADGFYIVVVCFEADSGQVAADEWNCDLYLDYAGTGVGTIGNFQASAPSTVTKANPPTTVTTIGYATAGSQVVAIVDSGTVSALATFDIANAAVFRFAP